MEVSSAYSRFKAADAQSVEDSQTAHHSTSTTITEPGDSEDFSAASATKDSVSWETVRLCFREHSTTCDIHRLYTFHDGYMTRSGAENWRKVPNGSERYYDALMRHLEKWRSGEIDDPETGLPHLAHASCCMMFLLGMEHASVVGLEAGLAEAIRRIKVAKETP